MAGCPPGARGGARRRATVAHDPFEMVRRFGTQVVEVERLSTPVAYVASHDIALVRAGLCPDTLTRAADWLLAEALRQSVRSPS